MYLNGLRDKRLKIEKERRRGGTSKATPPPLSIHIWERRVSSVMMTVTVVVAVVVVTVVGAEVHLTEARPLRKRIFFIETIPSSPSFHSSCRRLAFDWPSPSMPPRASRDTDPARRRSRSDSCARR